MIVRDTGSLLNYPKQRAPQASNPVRALREAVLVLCCVIQSEVTLKSAGACWTSGKQEHKGTRWLKI